MSDPALIGFPPEASGASDLGREEPHWIIARWQANRHGYSHSDLVTVDANSPSVQYEMTFGFLVPLPDDQQPKIITDPDTGEPKESE